MRISSQRLRNLGWISLVLVVMLIGWYFNEQNNARVAVISAKIDLVPGLVITDEHLSIRYMHPIDFQAGSMFTDSAQVIGSVVARQTFAEEPIVRSRLAAGACANTQGTKLSDLACSPKERLLSWPAREISIARQLQGGDLVDVTVIVGERTGTRAVAKTIIQRIRVVTVNRDDILLLVPVDTVEVLYFARANGDVQFTLAGPNADKVETPGITLDEFVRRFIVQSGASPLPSGSARPSGSATPSGQPGLTPSGSPSPLFTPTPTPTPTPIGSR